MEIKEIKRGREVTPNRKEICMEKWNEKGTVKSVKKKTMANRTIPK